jgi:hypothetical protein
MSYSIETLLSVQTATQIYNAGLEIMAAWGLPVTSWRTDDPTRLLTKFLARILATRDSETQAFVRAGFLTLAQGAWKSVVAEEMYGITRDPAEYAESTLVLTNNGGGYYEREAGDFVVKVAGSEVTYSSVEDFILTSGPGTTVTVTVQADVEGTAGNAATNAIDTFVTPLTDVVITSSTQAVGQDEQSDDSLETECLASLGALSPNGPHDGYNSVALNEELTGVSGVTRAWTDPASADLLVDIYIAGPSGAVSSPTVDAVQTAVELWATPEGFTPTVHSVAVNAVDFEYDVSGEGIPAAYATDLEAAVGAILAALNISSGISASALIAVAHNLLVANEVVNPSVALVSPATGVAGVTGYVVTVGSFTVNEV